ncbi:MAG: hypothetical protein K1Y36_11635 [Blastocatellia bacterium]|nr:hypothetical protein [Blastocatellia bacterium]
MKNLYQAIDIWIRKDEETLVRYRCFQVLPLGKFCVQSADFYRQPFDQVQSIQLEKQFLELFLEEAPEIRSGLFESLEAAIQAHEEIFGS